LIKLSLLANWITPKTILNNNNKKCLPFKKQEEIFLIISIFKLLISISLVILFYQSESLSLPLSYILGLILKNGHIGNWLTPSAPTSSPSWPSTPPLVSPKIL
jgi:hypothetical protein